MIEEDNNLNYIIKYIEKILILKKDFLLNNKIDEEEEEENTNNNNNILDNNLSFSTKASIDIFNLDHKDLNILPSKQENKNIEFINFFNKIKDILKELSNLIIKKGDKINFNEINNLYEILGINFIDKSEIDLFFLFLNDLIILKDKKIYFTEEIFTHFFYKILLRLDYSEFTNVIYFCLEKMLLFLNLKLNVIKIDKYNSIFLKENYIIGIEIIINLLINVDSKIKIFVNSFVNNLLKSFIKKNNDYIDQIYKIFYEKLIDNLVMIYEDSFNTDSIQKILSIIETIIFIIEEVDNIKLKNNTKNSLELLITDHTDNLNKKFKIKIDKNEKLKDLKELICKHLEINNTELLLFCKGKNLIGDCNSLFEFGISNWDKIYINAKSIDLFDLENKNSDLLKNQINQLMEIFPNLNYEFTRYLILKFNYNLEIIIEKISNEKEELEWLKEMKKDKENLDKKLIKSDNQIAKTKNNLRFKISENKNIFYILFKIKDLFSLNKTIENNLENFLKLIPCNSILLKNIKNYIENNKEKKIQIENEIKFENDSQNSEDLIRINKEEKNIKYEDLFDFDLNNILENPNNLNLYKLEIFKNFLIFHNIFENQDLNEKINLKFKFIENGIIKDLNDMALKFLEKNDQNYEKVLNILLNIMKPYYYILEFSDLNNPYKKLKNFNLDFGYLSEETKKKEKEDLDNPFKLKNNSPRSNITPGFGSFNISKSNSYKIFNYNDPENLSISKSIIYTINSKETNNLEEFQLFFKKIIKNELLLNKLKETLNSKIFFDYIFNFLINYDYIKSEIESEVFDILFKIILPLSEIKNGEILNIEKIIELFCKLKINNSNFISNYIIRILLSIEIKNEIKEKIKLKIFKWFVESFDISYTSNYFVTVSYNIIYIKELEDNIIDFVYNLLNHLKTIENEKKIVSIISILKHIFNEYKNQDFKSIFKEIIFVVFKYLFDLNKNKKTVIYSNKQRNELFKFLDFVILKDIEYLFFVLNFVLEKYFPINSDKILYYTLEEKNFELIGIKNWGATCYMNSLLQQLFYINDFTNFIINNNLKYGGLEININDSFNDKLNNYFSKNIFYQTINLFSNLKLSIKEYYIPNEFCENFTGFDNLPMNVKIQQDVNEFLNLFFFSIENEIEKLGIKKNIFSKFFNIQCVSEIVSWEENYPFVSENNEYYTSISLEVKNFNSIEKSLDNYLKGDILENDNSYYCEKYQRKIKANKKLYLKELPQNMIFTLNRFEYNYITGEKIKINNYYEIPLEINFKKWLKNKEDKFYKLVGVIVHSGNSEFGHYYSYINTNNQWYEFNDTKVSEFNPTLNNIKNEWFGQNGNSEIFENIEWKNNSAKSAYMLFYESKEIAEKRNHENIDIPKFLKEKILLENEIYFQKKVLIDANYNKFMNNLFYSFNNYDRQILINYIKEYNPNLKENKLLKLFNEKNNNYFLEFFKNNLEILNEFPKKSIEKKNSNKILNFSNSDTSNKAILSNNSSMDNNISFNI